MGSRDDPIDRATHRIRRSMTAIVEDLREARMGAGLSQTVVATRVGLSRSRLSRIERDEESLVPAEVLARLGAAVGIDVVIRAYAGDRRLRDAAHVRCLDLLRTRLGAEWVWRTEVPLGISSDQRAWDAVGVHRRTGLTVCVEVETQLRDSQAILRRMSLKRHDGGAARTILVVRDSRNNRAALREAERSFVEAFPIGIRRALPSLVDGRDPGGDALLVL